MGGLQDGSGAHPVTVPTTRARTRCKEKPKMREAKSTAIAVCNATAAYLDLYGRLPSRRRFNINMQVGVVG